MIASLLMGAVLIVCALVELVFPGRPIYHAGWFNVTLAAVAVMLVVEVSRRIRTVVDARARIACVVAAAAAVITGFAAIASGLLGPDDQTVVASPGQTVRIDELGGALAFPISNGASDARVELRTNGTSKPIDGAGFFGSFALQALPRTVVAVDASDARGAHLTITQPTGSEFLSPVLLMQGHQTIGGFDVPYDSFDVPAMHRRVKSVLFSAQQAAQLPGQHRTKAFVLFDVENSGGAETRGGLGVAENGVRVVIGGLGLRPAMFDYPAIRIVSIPNAEVTTVATLLAVAAAVFAAWVTRRARNAAPAA